MRIIKRLTIAVMGFALATGGIMVSAGAANATYSACLDTVAANGKDPAAQSATYACTDGAQNNYGSCVNILASNGVGLSQIKAELACKRAAIKPAP